jgi:hypothetical protein
MVVVGLEPTCLFIDRYGMGTPTLLASWAKAPDAEVNFTCEGRGFPRPCWIHSPQGMLIAADLRHGERASGCPEAVPSSSLSSNTQIAVYFLGW